MRLLFLNPNTSEHLTEMGAKIARGIVTSKTEIVPSTGRFGASYIATRVAATIAGHAALDAYARDGGNVDAVLIACFGDPGLLALKELATVPVTGMAEACCHIAAGLGDRFSIVTGGQRWRPMLEEFVNTIGFGKNLASVRTVVPTGDKIAKDPEAAYHVLVDECCRAVTQDGAQVIILAGLGLAGIADKIKHRVSVPVLDSVETSVRFAEQSVTRQASGVPTVSIQIDGASTRGLSGSLARRLASANRS